MCSDLADRRRGRMARVKHESSTAVKKIKVKGFLDAPKQTASQLPYQGRFTLRGVQWTGEGEDVFATLTITAEEIADAAENRLLWTDQEYREESNQVS